MRKSINDLAEYSKQFTDEKIRGDCKKRVSTILAAYIMMFIAMCLACYIYVYNIWMASLIVVACICCFAYTIFLGKKNIQHGHYVIFGKIVWVVGGIGAFLNFCVLSYFFSL